MKTRGVRYRESGGVEFVEFDVPDPGPGEVQVEAVACGICALDLFAYGHGTDAMPFVPAGGHEGLGYVTKVGPGVRGYEVGDRVAAGSFARITNVPTCNVDVPQICKLPESDRPDEHWIVEPVSCVVTGMDTSNLFPGHRVAVIGCGFMGLLLVQGLAHSCLDLVIGIDVNADRLALARSQGADRVYDATEAGEGAVFDELKALRLDTIIETSGTAPGLRLAERLASTGGRINVFGWPHDDITFSGNAWHLGGFTLVNSSPFGRVRDSYPAAARLIHKGIFSLEPLVTHVVALDDLPALMADVTSRRIPQYIKGVVTLR